MEDISDDELTRRVRRFFEEDSLLAEIRRTELLLEIRILIDGFMNNIQVSEETNKCYQELRSVVYSYIATYGQNWQVENIRERWKIPSKGRGTVFSYVMKRV
jgi:hypothetical protein